jgi:hypothetical protein
MKIKEIIQNIFNVKFDSQRVLAETFLRFQEYFESPKFKGKIFTLNEFKKWYIAHYPGKKEIGKFTYYKDWVAFNIPSYVLKPFYKGKFDPLSEKEQNFLDLFKDKRRKNFYIIGTCKKRKELDLSHEIAHGLFYTNKKYHKEVLGILNKIDPKAKRKIKDHLLEEGYDASVLTDELHAYILADLAYLRRHGIHISRVKSIHQKLKQIFKRYFESKKK